MISSVESAVSLLAGAEDLVVSYPSNETEGWRSRPLIIERESDTLDATKKLVETLTYLNPIDSPGCAAVSGRSYSWEDR